MPLHRPEKYLYDIIDCCGFVLSMSKGRTVYDYRNDRMFRSALERELQIIGEAMIKLDHAAPAIADRISEHRSIIGFRHVLVHGYDSLDPDTVWNVVETKIATLRDQAHSLLAEQE